MCASSCSASEVASVAVSACARRRRAFSSWRSTGGMSLMPSPACPSETKGRESARLGRPSLRLGRLPSRRGRAPERGRPWYVTYSSALPQAPQQEQKRPWP